MLDQLTDKLARVVKTMRGQARLTDANMQEMLREVRMALLEADVALPVVRDFVARIKEQALGADVAGSLTPGQALVGVVHGGFHARPDHAGSRAPRWRPRTPQHRGCGVLRHEVAPR